MHKKRKIKLYLDIDGVILGKNQNGEIALIPNIEEFLIYTKENFECYWLTTHCRDGRDEGLKRYLTRFFKGPDLGLLNHVKPLGWDTLKTEIIDFDSPFIWIDDYLMGAEIRVLKKKGCFDNWLEVNSYKNFHDLTVDRVEVKKREIISKE